LAVSLIQTIHEVSDGFRRELRDEICRNSAENLTIPLHDRESITIIDSLNFGVECESILDGLDGSNLLVVCLIESLRDESVDEIGHICINSAVIVEFSLIVLLFGKTGNLAQFKSHHKLPILGLREILPRKHVGFPQTIEESQLFGTHLSSTLAPRICGLAVSLGESNDTRNRLDELKKTHKNLPAPCADN
jgi:hypothetical protein